MKNLIYIAGASSRAQTTREYLEYLNPDMQVSEFLVSPGMPDCWDIIGGINVLPISEESELDTSRTVYIGTCGIHWDIIESELRDVGFTDIIRVTPEVDRRLRNAYVSSVFKQLNRRFVKINDLKIGESENKYTENAEIYVVSTAGNRLNDKYKLMPEEKMIQAGAALTKERISPGILTDDTGDNISDRNPQFCELTALYWIWKNSSSDFVGLAHYRRHFILPDDWVDRVHSHDIDVILPVPLFVNPNIKENFCVRHFREAWSVMLEKLELMHPRDYGFVKEYTETSGLYSPCNMFVMKREILNEYCEWVFPVLFSTVEEVGRHVDDYQNRYAGMLAERLMTAYFAKREKELNVVYADKNFLN